jgi:hypothetical protein
MSPIVFNVGVPIATVAPFAMCQTKIKMPLPISSSALPHFWTTSKIGESGAKSRKHSTDCAFDGAFGNSAVNSLSVAGVPCGVAAPLCGAGRAGSL